MSSVVPDSDEDSYSFSLSSEVTSKCSDGSTGSTSTRRDTQDFSPQPELHSKQAQKHSLRNNQGQEEFPEGNPAAQDYSDQDSNTDLYLDDDDDDDDGGGDDNGGDSRIADMIRRISDISDLPIVDRESFEKNVYMQQELQEEQLIRYLDWQKGFVERKDALLARLRNLFSKKEAK